MTPQFFTNFHSHRSAAKFASLFVALVLLSFLTAPEAQAQCSGTLPSLPTAGGVVIESCTTATSDPNVNNISLNLPAGTVSGDILIAAIATDGVNNFTTPTGWIPVQAGSSDANSLAIFKRYADGTEAGSYNFTWTNTDEVAAFIIRISGGSGLIQSVIRSGNGNDSTPPTERLRGGQPGDLTLRIGGFDGNGVGGSASIGGHTELTRTESGGGAGAATRVYAMYEETASADTGNENFNSGSNQEWTTVTLLIEQAGGGQSDTCPKIDGSIVGSQLVVLEQCTYFQAGNSNNGTTSNNIFLDLPDQAAVGDLLIAHIATDGNELPFQTDPTGDGFTLINEDEGEGITYATYSKVVNGLEPDHYAWLLNSQEQRVAFLALFSGASGKVIEATPPFTSATDSSAIVTPPPIETFVNNTLLLKMASTDDDDILVNESTSYFVGHTNFFSRSARESGGGGVSIQGTYINEVTATTPSVSVTAGSFPIQTTDESHQTSTIGIEPIEFAFSHDGTLSTCAIQEVTISALDSDGITLTNFTGTVSLSTSGNLGGNGTWSIGDAADGPEFPGNLVDSGLSDGDATYTFTSGDLGSVTLDFTIDTVLPDTLSFDLLWEPDATRDFTETQTPARDPVLTVDQDCEFRIEDDAAVDGTCTAQAITLTLVDSAGDPAENYEGTVDIELASGSGGEFVSFTGFGTLVDAFPDDGDEAQYTFDLADGGVVVLNYGNTTDDTYNFDAVDIANGYVTDTDNPSFDEDLVLVDCEIEVEVSTTLSDVCSIIEVTFTVVDAEGNTITGYDGQIDLSVAGAPTGDWFISSGAAPPADAGQGTLDNTVGGTGNGQATYDFVAGDAGEVTLEFRTLTVQTAPDPLLDINVGGDIVLAWGTANLVENAVGNGDEVDVAACTIVISDPDLDAADGQVCRDGIRIRYVIQDRNSSTATEFNGLLVLQTSGSPAIGNYEIHSGFTAFGTLDPDPDNDNNGIATYQFNPVAGDAGVLEVSYSISEANTPTLTASSAGFGATTPLGLTFNACQFQISFANDATPGTTDVCSVEIVTITILDSNSNPVEEYDGTVLLSTNTGDGTWAVSSANGTLFDPTPEDGAASYTFAYDGPGGDPDDMGTIQLAFTHTASNAAAVNIDIDDGITEDEKNPGSANDPNLFVDICTFQISFDGPPGPYNHLDSSITACEVESVTLEIFRSAGEGGGLATDYTGTVNLTTTNNNGNWSQIPAVGLLVDTPGDDDGAATYTFSGTEGGQASFTFTNLNAETMGIDVIDQVGGLNGVITEDGAADPNLTISSCLPAVAAQSCVTVDGTLEADITIDDATLKPDIDERMVIMALTWEGDNTVTSVNFDTAGLNAPMTELMTATVVNAGDTSFNNNTALYGILDANMPATGGTYTGAFTRSGTDSFGMCLLYLTDVEQVFPTAAIPAAPANTDPINKTEQLNTQVSSTTVTTTQNNALILSVLGTGQGTNQDTETYDVVSPDPPLSRLFTFNDPPDSADFAGSSGVSPTAAAITVDETYDGDDGTPSAPNRNTHIVAAFNPIITGPPVPVGYVPVTLFQTYAGDISYITIGATLRTQDNDANSCIANDFADADLTLPELDETQTDPGELLEGYVDPNPGVNDIDSNVLAAYLYWFGSGDVNNPPGGVNFDQVDFILDPLGTPVTTAITADDLFSVENVGGGNNLNYFAAYKDVTNLVTATGLTETYRVDNHPAQFTTPWSSTSACGGGWALVVVYESPFEQLRVINLFHGFQPFQNSAFTLVPRNFRMATPNAAGEVPNGQVTHVTLEGDYDIDNGDESLAIQDLPGATDPNNYIPLVTDYNPLNSEFNSTITRPVYVIQDIDLGVGFNYKYQWDDTANGVNQSNGYEIDFPGDQSPDARELGSSWGVDADTHYISGDENANGDALGDEPYEDAAAPFDENVLYPFAISNEEEITTRYSSGQDLVLLVSEVISVTNAPIADVEITLSETSPEYKVNSTGSYSVSVTNNGNGASSFGAATGNLTITGEMPAGYTFAAAGDVSGTDWTCSVTLDPGAFTCDYDIQASAANGPDGLDINAPTASPLNFTVQIGGPQDVPVVFPSLNNDAKVIVRLQHNERDVNGGCPVEVPGVMPDPALCEAPEFDNVNDLQGGIIDIDDLEDKTGNNNNVDSITTNVEGIETDLSIDKVLIDTLEQTVPPSLADFEITVTNLGPDDIVPAPTMTTPTIIINDSEPISGFIEFNSVTAPAGWDCGDPPGPPPLVAISNPGSTALYCEFSGTLLVGNSTTITLEVEVTGTDGDLVDNTASVASGLYNFDNNSGNNSDSDGGTITAPPASATERFLLSVSTAGLTTLGSGGGELANFTQDDIILYDPVLDEATMFLDNSVEGFGLNNVNALHLNTNGQVVISTAGSSTVGDNVLAFDPNDLVVYDPLTRQATLLFDGDSQGATMGVDFDAVYVIDADPGNPQFIFSTTADNPGNWDREDLVLWNGVSFSVYLDGTDTDIFGDTTENLIDAAYIRVDPTDANQVIDNFVLSSAFDGTIVADDNNSFGQDDVIEVFVDDNTNPDVTSSDNLFNGNVPIGVFSPFDSSRTISALHLLEDGYLGHFAITQSQAGSACEVGKITISKHEVGGGSSHQVDTDYTGTILISLDGVSDGDWSLDTGNGTLDNGTLDDGMATYTFVASDNGQVTLNLDVTEATPTSKSVNVNVTNGFVTELGTEDDTFNFNLVITDVTYRDNFNTSAFDNNDGSTGWANDWQEIDGFDGVSAGSGAGPGIGNVQISGGVLSLTSNPNTDGNFEPSLEREADLSLFTANQDTFLTFDYSYSNLNAADSVIVEVSDDSGANWETVVNLTGLSGTNASTTNVQTNLSTLGGVIDDFTGNIAVRFRVANGYTLASVMNIHNVELSTGTTDCGIGLISRYRIEVASTGVACAATTVTITGLDSNDFPSAPGNGTVINLSTSTGAGTWASVLSGAGTLVDIGGPGTNTDGQASYTFLGSENSIQLQFNYTNPVPPVGFDFETVEFNISGDNTEVQGNPAYDPTIDFYEAGILFYDENTSSTTLPFQIAGKPSTTAPATGLVTIQLVRSVDLPGENEALACESLVGAGDTISINLAGMCENPTGCQVGNMTVVDAASSPQSVPMSSFGPAPIGSGIDVDLEFSTQPTIVEGENNIGATLNFSYADAGLISLHAQYEIPFDNDIAGVASGDFISGSSDSFVVRPFGLDIDFSNDRRSDTNASLATGAADPAFARAGAPIDTTISGVVWDAADDGDVDGLPDFEADLSDNDITPNFGLEGVSHTVVVAVTTDDPNIAGTDDNPGVPLGVTGSVVSGNEFFTSFMNGSSGGSQNLAIDEVGIFDLNATYIDDTISQTPINYLGANDDNGVEAGITGQVANVGRIYPNNFELASSSFGPRVNQNMSCAPSSPFTYMGEDFGLNIEIRAVNLQDEVTENYIDDFAKLTTLGELQLRAIIDVSPDIADVDLSSRLVNSSLNGIATNFSGSWSSGVLTISGDMNIARLGSGAEDAPLENVQIAFSPIDDNDDGIGGMNNILLDVLDVDLDDGITEPGTDEFRLISTHEFRYGRLIVENAFGPETEDLEIPLSIEYFDGTDFIRNTDDSCTSFLFDISSPTPALDFVPDTYEENLEAIDTEIEAGALLDVEVNLYEGITARLQDGDDSDENDPDRPFITSAPDVLADEDNTGRVLIEFDLDNSTLTTPLDFLSYDWRTVPEVDEYDEIPDGDYTDNPRGVVEFGTYRGHDRVINWQEIYIGN